MKLNRAVQLYDKLLGQRLTSYHHHPMQPQQTVQQYYQTPTIPSSSSGMYPQTYVPPNRNEYSAGPQSNASQFPLTAPQNTNRGINYGDPAGSGTSHWVSPGSTTGYPASGTSQQLPPYSQPPSSAPYQPIPDDKPLIDL